MTAILSGNIVKMKSLWPILTFLFGIIPLSTWAQPSSPEEFITSLRKAIQEKSPEKLNAITYTVGMSEADKKQVASVQEIFFGGTEVVGISLEPLPADFRLVGIINGKKYEPTYPPTGLIKIQYKKAANGPDSLSQAYAIIGGQYFLISTKSTELGWKGPPDKPLSFMVMGWVQDKVQIKAKWNTSGVDQEQIYKMASNMVFMGQYFENVTVTSTDDNTNVTLVVSEDNKEIFHSQPIKGKGSIEYRKS